MKFIDNVKFIKVAESKNVYERKGIKIQFEGDDDFQVAIIRYEGKLYCLDNICPHRHADKIFEGIIKDKTVTCPLHGWTYSLETGENIDIKKGIKKLKTYLCFEEDGIIYIEEPKFEIPKWRK
jgi:nitrite reductase/ring-hydroxylating ferredoxin subunit